MVMMPWGRNFDRAHLGKVIRLHNPVLIQSRDIVLSSVLDCFKMSFVMAFRPYKWIKQMVLSPPFRVLIATGKTFFLGHLISQYGFSQGATRGASMLPTIEVLGDSVIVSKQYRRGRNVKVGDVVQFDSVAEPRESVIKRVIGLEGDYVLRNSPGSRYDDMIQVSCI